MFQLNSCTEDTNFCPLERISCLFVQLSVPSALKGLHCQGFSLKHGPMEQGLLLLFHICTSKYQSAPSMLHPGRYLSRWRHSSDSRKPPEHGKGLQRSLKGAGDSAFCSSTVLAGWEFVLVSAGAFSLGFGPVPVLVAHGGWCIPAASR